MYISYHTHDNGIVYSVKFSFDIYCICTLRAALRFVYILNISIDIVYICIRVYVVYICMCAYRDGSCYTESDSRRVQVGTSNNTLAS